MKKQIVTIALLLTPHLQAEINMKDASYTHSISDTKEIRRTYNSRSLYSGYFGFGWCSNIEESLDTTNNKEIVLKKCDLETPFVLMDENNSLKTRVFENPITKERIYFKNGIYSLVLEKDEIKNFNRKGQLTSIIDKLGNKSELTYTRNILVQLKYNQELPLQFFFNETQVTKIESAKGQTLYLYEKDNLIQSVGFNKKSYLYEYDQLNNMISLTFPDKTIETIVYNNDHDRVVKIQLKNECTDYYDFYSKDNDSLHQVSTLTRKCDNKTTHQYIYEFWYKQRSDGLKYLERYKIKQNSQTLDITYNPFNGNPVRILKNGRDLNI